MCRWGGVNRSSGLVVMVMCSQGSMREIGVPRVTECAEWQQGLGIELVREVIKSEEWKRLKLKSLAEDCPGLRDMMLAMLRGDTNTVDVKKVVKYAWENTYVRTIHAVTYVVK